MPSTFIQCPKGAWTQINVVSTQGVFELASGHVVFTQQTTKPTADFQNVPKNGSMSLTQQERVYDTSREPGEFIYAYGVENSVISITPVGGVV